MDAGGTQERMYRKARVVPKADVNVGLGDPSRKVMSKALIQDSDRTSPDKSGMQQFRRTPIYSSVPRSISEATLK